MCTQAQAHACGGSTKRLICCYPRNCRGSGLLPSEPEPQRTPQLLPWTPAPHLAQLPFRPPSATHPPPPAPNRLSGEEAGGAKPPGWRGPHFVFGKPFLGSPSSGQRVAGHEGTLDPGAPGEEAEPGLQSQRTEQAQSSGEVTRQPGGLRQRPSPGPTLHLAGFFSCLVWLRGPRGRL